MSELRIQLRRRLVTIALVGLACFLSAAGARFLKQAWTASWFGHRLERAAGSSPASEPPLRVVAASFGRNQTVADALARHGVSGHQIHRLVESTRPIYNLAKVAATRPYWLYLTPAGDFHDFRYQVDDERYLTVYRQDGRFIPVMKNFRFETRIETLEGEIEDSLFGSITGIGEQDALALQLADIFMWDVDFYTDIQKGDSFRMLVEKKYLDGKFVKYGCILAADLRNQGRDFRGFRFQDEKGSPGYYGPDGRSLKKSFLKSPLKFARISSRFSKSRLHPILRIFRPHLGIDYAAPTGTPVQAVGAGVVQASGYQAGGGKMVKLRHSGGYETMYLHLSKILVKPGARVEQGQVIGFVGATGLATGPHLDFRILSHGRFVNPSKVIFPPAEPVSKSSFAQFAVLRDRLQSQLNEVH